MNSSPFRLLLTSVSGWNPSKQDEWGRGALKRLEESASLNTDSRFIATSQPEDADAILFCECRDQGAFHEFIRRDPLYRKFASKCLVYDPSDLPVPTLPGLFPSLIKGSFPASWAESTCYIHASNPRFEPLELDLEQAHLFSFTGTIKNHPVRQRLLAFHTADTPVIDIANAAGIAAMRNDTQELLRLKTLFSDVARKSAFMLCPAGVGSGSFRLFEAMQCRRAPVIISDNWAEVSGPDWSGFAIRIAEADIEHLRDILQERRKDALEMGIYARREWEKFFSSQTLFATVAGQCQRILQARQQSGDSALNARRQYLLQKPIVRYYLRTRKQMWNEYHRLCLW